MKFTAAILALAAVSSAEAFTVTNPAKGGITVEWTTEPAQPDFQMKMTDDKAAGGGYACIGISYGSNGGYHNSMESYCTSQDNGGTTRLYVGPSNSKSMPVFPGGQNPQGYTAAPGGDSLLKAVAINTNGGTTTATWTRTKANKYTGADVGKEAIGNGPFLNQEWYYEDNKEYVIWYAQAAAKNLNQKHDGTGKWSNDAELFRVTDPLTPRECPADYVCTGLSATYTGENKPLPAICTKQNSCSNSDCCVKAPRPDPTVPVVDDTPADPLETPGGDGTGDQPGDTTVIVNDPDTPVKSLCPADFPCSSGWKRVDQITLQGCLQPACELSECCVPDGSSNNGSGDNGSGDNGGSNNPDNGNGNGIGNGNGSASAFAPTAVTALLASISALFLYL